MLHGHAKIELTNVKTGITKTIEHDNMLTDYYKDVFTPRTIYGRTIIGSGKEMDKAYMFGGVVLFEDEVDTNASHYDFPHDNKMIARGSNIAYSGVDRTLGSYNETLSVIEDDSATFVWDFTQERGNGNISSIGLTSVDGGLIGGGRDDDGDKNNDVVVSINLLREQETPSTTGSGSPDNAYIPAWVNEDNNVIYYAKFNSAGTQLNIFEVQYPVDEIDLIHLKTRTDRVVDVSKGVERTITISTGYSNPKSFANDGKLYFIGGQTNWTNGTSKSFGVYDFDNHSLGNSISVMNNTGKTIVIGSGVASGFTRQTKFAIYNGYLYARTSDRHIVYINLDDNTDCGIVVDGAGTQIVRGGDTEDFLIAMFGNLIFSAGEIYANGKGSDAQKTIYVLDSKGVARRRNIAPLNVVYGEYAGAINVSGYAHGFYISQSSGALYRAYNPMCLATKLNLENPVTKTADMTMRISYTITEASE